jgi:hypothetical protein
MKTNKYISLFIAIVLSAVVQAQNVGINASGATPNTSAMLDVNSSTKGVLIPQVALTSITDVTTITSGNVNSLLVYNTATAGTSPNNVIPAYYYWNATAGKWFQIAASSGSTGNNMFSGFQVFTASGTFTIPTGVSRVMIEMWGGGGGGGGANSTGGCNTTGAGGDGGGGGAYSKSLFNVTSNIIITIGAGGAGGATGSHNGSAGGTTSVSGGAVMSAGGGSGGLGNDCNGTITAGGTPATTSASVLGIYGYSGGGQTGGATGGAGGSAPAGGAGGQPNSPGTAGGVPGGGGSGASQTNAGGAAAGGAGAAGMVIIWW